MMTIGQVLTAVVAVYGAVLSTINLTIQLRAKRWRVVAFYSLGVHDQKQVIILHASNLGERPVTLKRVWIKLERGQRHWLPRVLGAANIFRGLFWPRWTGEMTFDSTYVLSSKPPLPAELNPGSSAEVILNQDAILDDLASRYANSVEYIVGAFEDAIGRRYMTRPMIVNLNTRKVGFT